MKDNGYEKLAAVRDALEAKLIAAKMERDRLTALVAPIVASVHGVIPKGLADAYTKAGEQVEWLEQERQGVHRAIGLLIGVK